MAFPESVDFHEDDYCQIEILPLSMRSFCLAQMNEIDEFSATHKTCGGWTDIYLREEPPKSLKELAVPIDLFKSSVEKTLTPYEKVTTGYGSHVEECRNCFAWRLGARDFVIFADTGPGKTISISQKGFLL
jgi:hypothetical protein